MLELKLTYSLLSASAVEIVQIDRGDIVRCRRRNFNVEFSPGSWVSVRSYDNNYLALHLIAGNNIVYLEDFIYLR